MRAWTKSFIRTDSKKERHVDCMFIDSFVRCRTPPRIQSLPYHRGIVPWTRSGEKINIFVAVITALSRLREKMQLYDTYVNCDSKLWTCLMEKRCSGCLFHFWKTTVVPHSGHESRHLTPSCARAEASTTRIQKRISNPRLPNGHGRARRRK